MADSIKGKATLPGKKLGEAATLDAGLEDTAMGVEPTLTDPGGRARRALATDEPLPDLREVGDGELEVLGEVARGGMGRILRARDRRHGREVALKEILRSSNASRARFAREALITARLQHPGIVPVYEFAAWKSGEPFFSMKLVDGRSLSAEIKVADTVASRLALLPKVIDAARAIAYAHEQGVIHRDLKPSNILVGGFGETVVIDWGLAKDLNDDDEAPVEPSASSDSELTVAGSVMGTPSYMPLEQADGDELDERADVYALGAILYHLVAGEPPYRADSGDAVLALVRGNAPIPLAKRDAAVPADLVTIIDKAMARRREDRYASGVELAQELERFTTGQLVGAHSYSLLELVKRRLRRHRGALVVSAVAALALIVISAVSIKQIIAERNEARSARADAEAARGDADEQRDRAEGLVDFMLADLSEKLAPVGQMGLLRDVAARARAYTRDGDAAARGMLERQRRVAALYGDIRRGEGDIADAEASFREELRYATAIVERDKSADATLKVAAAHRRVASALREQGQSAEALAELERSKELLATLGSVDAVMDEVSRELADVLEAEGMVKLLGNEIGGAREAFKLADVAISAQWEQNKDDPDAALAMLQVRSKLADIELAGGNGKDALAIYDDTMLRVRELTIPEAVRSYVESRLELKRGNALGLLSRDAEAIEAYKKSAAIVARLSKLEPDNKAFVFDLSVALGNQAQSTPDSAAAQKLWRRAIALMEGIATGPGASAEWRGHRGSLHADLGMSLLAQKKPRQARKELERALEILSALEAEGVLVEVENHGERLELVRKTLESL